MDSVNSNGLSSAMGRVGSEEFIVVLPLTSLRGALRSAERPFTATMVGDNGYPGAGNYPQFQNPEGGDDQFIGVLRSTFSF